MGISARIQAFVGYFSEMLRIFFANRLVDLRFRLGLIGDRRQVLTHYVLLKAVRAANQSLLRYGFKREEVDCQEFGLLIRRCRRDTLRYIRHCRKKEREQNRH